MFGLKDLKDYIEITDTAVECPVKICSEKVERQRNYFRHQKQFKCPIHKIYISPTTFEYSSHWDNMLWNAKDDQQLFNKISKVKRESRIAREKSEDAVTWNVFRYLERNGLMELFLSSVIHEKIKLRELIYWSYSQKENGAWTLLNKARKEFGEEIKRGSEPDIIVKTNKALFFIEAKLYASNNTVPSDNTKLKKYVTGSSGWFSEVFQSDYETIAITDKKYELLRFWLIGTWIAKQLGIDFYLINLVLRDREINIEDIFGKYIKKLGWNIFIRITWESIYQFILDTGIQGPAKDMMIDYYKNKTIGYDQKREIQKAFSV